MRPKSTLSWALAAVTLLLVGGTPTRVPASSYLMTAFVPEASTTTVDLTATLHDEAIEHFELERVTYGARLSYVLRPALEGMLQLDLLDYRLEGLAQKGLGLTGGLKYQFGGLARAFDAAVSLQGSYGMADEITETEACLLGLISRDTPDGWTPFGGFGLSVNRQEFSGAGNIAAVSETRFDPVLFLGLKYLLRNRLGVAAEVFSRDGVGGSATLGWRF
jgi:hypothetical protein